MALAPPPLTQPPLSPDPYQTLPSTPIPTRSWLKRWLPDLSHLPNPGKFEEYSKESQEITTTQEYFDGMKFDFMRTLSENFMVHHSLTMASTDANGGGTYGFAPQVTSRNKKTMFMGRFDGDGRVIGRIHHAFSPKFTIFGLAQVSTEQSMVQAEATYSGNNWVASAKLEAPNVVEVTMMQSIAANASLGMQVVHVPQAAITGASVVARIWGGREILKTLTQQRVPRWVVAGSMGTIIPFHASFTWHTPYKADFATELALHAKQDGSMETIWCAGALYMFPQGRIKARVDSHARVGVYVEEVVSPAITGYLCGDLDHYQNKYKIGLGITLQS